MKEGDIEDVTFNQSNGTRYIQHGIFFLINLKNCLLHTLRSIFSKITTEKFSYYMTTNHKKVYVHNSSIS